jgi:hypothetical protein
VKLTDLVKHLEFISSRRFIDVFEAQITSQIKLISSQGRRATWWSDDVRQHLRYALFLRYYASFEKYLKVICDRFAETDSLQLRLSDISGDNFLNRVNKYLTRVVNCEALDKHPLWLDLLSYLWIRNQLVHNDGEVHESNIPQYVKRQLTCNAAGLSMRADRRIRFKRRFCYRAIRQRQMADFLLDVYDRQQLPPASQHGKDKANSKT